MIVGVRKARRRNLVIAIFPEWCLLVRRDIPLSECTRATSKKGFPWKDAWKKHHVRTTPGGTSNDEPKKSLANP